MRRATNSRGGIDDVGVEEYDQLRGRLGEPGSHSLRPLPLGTIEANHACSVVVRDRGRVVDRVVVHHHQFVDQLAVGEHGVEDRTDRGRLVAGRDDDRDGGLGFQADDAFEVELFAAKRPRDVGAAHS